MTSEHSAVPPVPPAEHAQPATPPASQPYGQATPSPYYSAPQSPYGAGQPGPARGMSIASMVLGIVGVVLSFTLMGFLPALAAVILGHIARKKEPAGGPFSLTGIITGYSGLALSVIIGFFTLAVLLLPFWITSSVTGY